MHEITIDVTASMAINSSMFDIASPPSTACAIPEAGFHRPGPSLPTASIAQIGLGLYLFIHLL